MTTSSRLTVRQRFEKAYTVSPSGCWEWHQRTDKCGYGAFKLDGRMRLAHRVAYELLVGPIPDGLTIDHLCRNRRCVNPAHMEPVTAAINTLRGISFSAVNAAKVLCRHGHPFDDANTYLRSVGGRNCRECNRVAQAACKQRKKARAA